ncbi:hypothetical protein GN109_05665 [Collimonas pratensis]|uniref:hypothetical protein n=1 Tax=Collimonas pratensis TaxID=279113 RepID=UPI00143DBB5E|nr:hypothetical protein [Collimonas pratensis]NKI68901.1 hypothetical protein [Collimonas pratensis]
MSLYRQCQTKVDWFGEEVPVVVHFTMGELDEDDPELVGVISISAVVSEISKLPLDLDLLGTLEDDLAIACYEHVMNQGYH